MFARANGLRLSGCDILKRIAATEGGRAANGSVDNRVHYWLFLSQGASH
jgi:hypothetical protein